MSLHTKNEEFCHSHYMIDNETHQKKLKQGLFCQSEANCIRDRFTWLLLIFLTGCLTLLLSFGQYHYQTDYSYFFIDTSKVVFYADEKFLSVALDTSFMKLSFKKLNVSEWKTLAGLAHALSPGYIRLGGTKADQVLFKAHLSNHDNIEADEISRSDLLPQDVLIITGEDWTKLNTFIQETGLIFLYDLNVLLRNETDWDSSNAELLIKFSEEHNLHMDFQLGNEPNSFKHVFNVSVPGVQLGKDFQKLRGILNESKMFRRSKLIGPDVTRPRDIQESSLNYLKDFLSSSSGSLSAVSWHQYYFSGRNASLQEFINPKVMNELARQIEAVKKIVREVSPVLPIWISETSSAYGGGAPGLSDRYASSFLWLDKLGLAAKLGISVIIRQTFFQGYYSLVDSDMLPLPDFWISFFYKRLVSNQVLKLELDDTNESNVRLYGHCLNQNVSDKIQGSVAVFGMNLENATKRVVASGMFLRYPVYSYTFTPEDNDLTSKFVLLNGRKLKREEKPREDLLAEAVSTTMPLTMPAYSIVFWVFQEVGASACTT